MNPRPLTKFHILLERSQHPRLEIRQHHSPPALPQANEHADKDTQESNASAEFQHAPSGRQELRVHQEELGQTERSAPRPQTGRARLDRLLFLLQGDRVVGREEERLVG